MKALEIRNLSKCFDGVSALSGANLSFDRGAITALIGPNGSGKTTLVNVLSGICAFDSGSVVFRGHEAVRISREYLRAMGVSRTFQEVRLFEQMSVLDNLFLAYAQTSALRALCEGPMERQREQAETLLERVGLAPKCDAMVRSLSYGQRKLLEIARVLALEADIILFDEPFAGLFPQMVERVAGIMRELRERGVTQILIEHNIELVRRLADRVIVLDAGSELASGSADAVFSNPRVIEAYLGT